MSFLFVLNIFHSVYCVSVLVGKQQQQQQKKLKQITENGKLRWERKSCKAWISPVDTEEQRRERDRIKITHTHKWRQTSTAKEREKERSSAITKFMQSYTGCTTGVRREIERRHMPRVSRVYTICYSSAASSWLCASSIHCVYVRVCVCRCFWFIWRVKLWLTLYND